MRLPDQAQNVSILVVSAMLTVNWLGPIAATNEQEMALPTPEQLCKQSFSRKLDMFKATCKILRIPKAIEMIWARQRLMRWFHAVITSWIDERMERHMSRNAETYQSFLLNIGPGAY